MKKLHVQALAVASVLLIAGAAWSQECSGADETCRKLEEMRKMAEASQGMPKAVAGAAGIAVILKLTLSILKSWQDFFISEPGKTWLRIITLGVGAVVFVVTLIGYGMPWWQAAVLAAGGPGAIVVHEISKLLPMMRKPGAPSDPDKAADAALGKEPDLGD